MARDQKAWQDRFGDLITVGAEAVLGPPCPATFQMALVTVVGFATKNVKVEVKGNGRVLSVRPHALIVDRSKFERAMTAQFDGTVAERSKMTPLHGDRGGRTLERFAGQLARYFDEQGPEVEARRDAAPGERPYPDPDNPAFGYLVNRAAEIHDGRRQGRSIDLARCTCLVRGRTC